MNVGWNRNEYLPNAPQSLICTCSRSFVFIYIRYTYVCLCWFVTCELALTQSWLVSKWRQQNGRAEFVRNRCFKGTGNVRCCFQTSSSSYTSTNMFFFTRVTFVIDILHISTFFLLFLNRPCFRQVKVSGILLVRHGSVSCGKDLRRSAILACVHGPLDFKRMYFNAECSKRGASTILYICWYS